MPGSVPPFAGGNSFFHRFAGGARPLRTRVRVHIIAGYDVDPHVARGTRALRSGPAGEGDRSLAAAIVEQFHVGVAEVPVHEAIQQIVEAGLAKGEPRGQVEHLHPHF